MTYVFKCLGPVILPYVGGKNYEEVSKMMENRDFFVVRYQDNTKTVIFPLTGTHKVYSSSTFSYLEFFNLLAALLAISVAIVLIGPQEFRFFAINYGVPILWSTEFLVFTVRKVITSFLLKKDFGMFWIIRKPDIKAVKLKSLLRFWVNKYARASYMVFLKDPQTSVFGSFKDVQEKTGKTFWTK